MYFQGFLLDTYFLRMYDLKCFFSFIWEARENEKRLFGNGLGPRRREWIKWIYFKSKIMKFQINNFKMSRREASRHFEIIYEKFHNFWCEINSFNSFSSSRAQSISKKSNFNFRVLLDERMDLTYPNIGVLAFLTNFGYFVFKQD